MSVHPLTLTGYSTKRVQTCTSVAQTSSDVPNSPLTTMHRIPTILFPADELPRPAVIGLGGSNGSYVDSAMAIKEILASVLNIPTPLKSALTVNMNNQDSDTENWEESSNDDSDSDQDHPPSLQRDIRLTRHKASWDNTQTGSPVTFAEPTTSSQRDPITSIESNDIQMGLSPFLTCDHCAEVLLIGSNASQLNMPLNSQRDRCFSSPNLSSLELNLHLNPDPPIPPSGKNPTSLLVDTDSCTEEDSKTFHRRSKSYSSISKEVEDSVTLKTEHLHHPEENLFEPAVNLERENGHFLAAELFMSVVEKMKSNWQYEQWRTEGGMYWMRKDQDEPSFHRKKANSESATSVDSGYEGLAALQNSPAETIFEEDESKHSIEPGVYIDFDEFVIIELEDYETLGTPKPPNVPERPLPQGSNSAEQTAKNLYRAFRRQWLPVDGEAPLPIKLTTDVLASNRTITEEFESSINLVEEIKKFSIRDTEEWSPRFQIISTVHPYVKRDVIVASQNYLCAGCGTKVEPRYTNRLRYCDYLGKYFCDCCHNYTESFIPGRILSKWNFSKYYVSNFAKSIVDRIWDSHLFNIQTENPALYKKVKDLNRVREVQEQLIHVKKLVSTCRFADGVLKAFEEVPSHLTQELHLFTLSDLFKVKQKTLLLPLRELLATVVAHVDKCELCQAKGFICEFCQHTDVIFPFQTETCRRCEVCKACYHKQCFKTGECPKCTRIKAREALKYDSPLTSSSEMDSNST